MSEKEFLPEDKTVDGAKELVYAGREIVLEQACTYKTIEAAKLVARLIGVIDIEAMLPQLIAASQARDQASLIFLAQKLIPMIADEAPEALWMAIICLDRLVEWKKKTDHLLVGIADVDLYVPSLNFVFGEASPRTGVCVISIVRLRQEFYRLPSEEELLRERTVKEAVHEIGHLVGLAHCPDPKCVMHFSNSLPDTDEKSTDFCRLCRRNV